ncbi:MAG: YfhO family protein [Pseudomonadota bacterium]
MWNPYQFSGHPFFANPQYAILYPLNGLFFLLPFDVAFNAIIILHFFLGGFFTYLLLRDLKASSTGSIISGLIFMLSGYLLSVHSLLTILLSVIWTPLIMMFFRRSLVSRRFKDAFLTAIFITLSFLGGGIEIVYGNFFVLLFMVIFPLQVDSPPEKEQNQAETPCRRIGGGVRTLGIVTLIFLILSAIQLLPFLELFHHSIRGSGISYNEATVWSFAPKDLLLFFLPDAYGYFLDMKKYWTVQCWLKTLYTGGLPFILSFLFFLWGKNRKLFLALMLFSFFLSLGHYNPFYFWVYKYAPFFDGIRYPVKFLYIFILVLSISAGLGFEKLSALPKDREKKSLKNLFVVFSLVSCFFLLFFIWGHKEIETFLKAIGIDFPHFNQLSINLYHAKRFLFYSAIFFLVLRVGQEWRWKRWIKVLLIFFLSADLFGNMGFYGKEKSFDFFQKTGILEMIAADKGPFRVFATRKTISMDTPIFLPGGTPLDLVKAKHLPTMNLLHGVHDLWGIDVIRLKRVDDLYRAFTGAPSLSATNLVDLYSVKYVISVTPLEGDPRFELMDSGMGGSPGGKEDFSEYTVKLYRHKNPLPRGWLVKNVKVMDSKAILAAIIDKNFHPAREALLEEEPELLRSATAPPSGQNPPLSSQSNAKDQMLFNKVELISESNNRLRLQVKTTENALLVLSDTYSPGWKALVNGTEKKIYRVNYTFRALSLAPGTYSVEFIYDPLSVKLGALITFLGIFGCLVIGKINRKRESNLAQSGCP